MLVKIANKDMAKADQGWLESCFHFSFAQYHDPLNKNFGVLRVFNDDIIHPKGGFGMHPHQDMEIITYIVEGEITHKDSMGNSETLKRGEVQYMSAGTGVEHSEYNLGDTDLRSLQIWILPPKKSLPTLYGSYKFKKEDSQNRFLHMISSQSGDGKIKLHQDVNIYVTQLEQNKSLQFGIKPNRQIYFVQIEGEALINTITLNHGDALKIYDEENLEIKAKENSHFLFIEMAKG